MNFDIKRFDPKYHTEIKEKINKSKDVLTLPIEFSEIKKETKGDGTNVAIIKGYAAAFNNIDFGNDRILPGAFSKTIQEKNGKWPILADHNPSKHIGFNVSAEEDHYGLKIEEEINLDVQIGVEKYALAQQALSLGVKAGLSIGYRAVKYDFEEIEGYGLVRDLKEIKMYEHSHVTFPMNDNAFVIEKSLCAKSLVNSLFEQSKSLGIKKEEVIKMVLKEVESNEPDSLIHSLKELSNIFKS